MADTLHAVTAWPSLTGDSTNLQPLAVVQVRRQIYLTRRKLWWKLNQSLRLLGNLLSNTTYRSLWYHTKDPIGGTPVLMYYQADFHPEYGASTNTWNLDIPEPAPLLSIDTLIHISEDQSTYLKMAEQTTSGFKDMVPHTASDVKPTTHKANCHCGAVRFTVTLKYPFPKYKINKCNCSICTKNGYLLVYPLRRDVVWIKGKSFHWPETGS